MLVPPPRTGASARGRGARTSIRSRAGFTCAGRSGRRAIAASLSRIRRRSVCRSKDSLLAARRLPGAEAAAMVVGQAFRMCRLLPATVFPPRPIAHAAHGPDEVIGSANIGSGSRVNANPPRAAAPEIDPAMESPAMVPSKVPSPGSSKWLFRVRFEHQAAMRIARASRRNTVRARSASKETRPAPARKRNAQTSNCAHSERTS